jgi:heme/copper-type cytochrome/quinol oxidase subunit 1
LEHGQVCESNNQCLNGVCSQNTCQDNDNTSVTTANATAGESGGYTTVHIILTVVGIVLFLSLVCIGIFIFKRKKNKPAAQAAATTDKEQQLTNIPPVKTTSRSNSSSSSSSSSSLTTTTHHNVTNILDYESTFLSPSPSQQQQELQFQLLKIQQQTAPPPPPPPPYSP